MRGPRSPGCEREGDVLRHPQGNHGRRRVGRHRRGDHRGRVVGPPRELAPLGLGPRRGEQGHAHGAVVTPEPVDQGAHRGVIPRGPHGVQKAQHEKALCRARALGQQHHPPAVAAQGRGEVIPHGLAVTPQGGRHALDVTRRAQRAADHQRRVHGSQFSAWGFAREKGAMTASNSSPSSVTMR
jgi:hypothetical protein